MNLELDRTERVRNSQMIFKRRIFVGLCELIYQTSDYECLARFHSEAGGLDAVGFVEADSVWVITIQQCRVSVRRTTCQAEDEALPSEKIEIGTPIR